MFHRIQVEQWQNVLAIVSFSLFFGSFLLTLVRVALMKKTEIEQLENLPLVQEVQSND